MAKFIEKKIVRVGNSFGCTLPTDIMVRFRKQNKKTVWIVVLEEGEEPTSERLLEWIYSKK